MINLISAFISVQFTKVGLYSIKILSLGLVRVRVKLRQVSRTLLFARGNNPEVQADATSLFLAF